MARHLTDAEVKQEAKEARAEARADAAVAEAKQEAKEARADAREAKHDAEVKQEAKEARAEAKAEKALTDAVDAQESILIDAGCWHKDVNGWHLSAPFTYVGPSGQWTAPSSGPMPLAEAVETEKKRPK